MGTTSEGQAPTDGHDRAREGVEHLQAAARELIAAARAALDVVEEWVEEPESVASMAGVLAAMGDAARRLAGTGAPPRAADADSAPPPADRPRVERIRVT